MRKKTTEGQKLNENFLDDVKKFIEVLNYYRMNNEDHKILANYDEVGVNFDMSSDYTYELSGQREVAIQSHSQNKLKFTVSFCILSNGYKYPPLIIFKYDYPCQKKSNMTEN